MEVIPKILMGTVMHARLFPKKNSFKYGIYYLSYPLSFLKKAYKSFPLSVNALGLMSLYEKDHGARDGSSLEAWVRNILETHDVVADGAITLITMPRIFGYVFNPISFFLCYNKEAQLKAIVCEVNNTFGETHSYLCKTEGELSKDIVLKAEKVFHVSPFLETEGHYTFRFHVTSQKFIAWIDYYTASGDKQLATCLSGDLKPMNSLSLLYAFCRYPFVALIALMRIHIQALKLTCKGIRYIPKPPQRADRLTDANITKI